MRTRVSITAAGFLKFSVRDNLKRKAQLLLARALRRSRFVRNAFDLDDRYQQFEAQRELGALTTAEVGELTRFQVDKVNLDHQNRATLRVDDQILAGSRAHLYQSAARLVLDVLRQRPDIRQVVNVGARTDVVSSYLAGRFPQIEFVSVDFQPNLADHNSSLPQHANWKFVSGYALSLFQSGALRPDLVLFSSTSVLFRNAELRAYLAALAGFARCVVINEPWYAPAETLGLPVVRPEQVDPQHSLIGGPYCNYHHNYIRLLEDAGFRVLSSELIDDVIGTKSYRLSIVAENQAPALDAQPAGEPPRASAWL
jgi:hypothetical protein